MASRHRAHQDREELAKRGVSSEFVTALRSPVGLDIGAKTPEELALAIMAEVVAVKYGKSPARPQPT
jgi:xanthine dehydrogenase accessory factor